MTLCSERNPKTGKYPHPPNLHLKCCLSVFHHDLPILSVEFSLLTWIVDWKKRKFILLPAFGKLKESSGMR